MIAHHITAGSIRPRGVTVAGVTALATAVVVGVGGAILTEEALDVRLAVTLSGAVVAVPGRARTVAQTCCNVEGSACLLGI